MSLLSGDDDGWTHNLVALSLEELILSDYALRTLDLFFLTSSH